MKQSERQERSRREILRAATEEFGTHNYEDVTIDSICSLHGISKGMMYHYYSGKDELFLLCAGEMFQALREYMEEAMSSFPDQGGLEAIRSLFGMRESYFGTRPLEKNIFENALFRTPKHLSAQIDALRLPLRELNRELFHRAVSHMELREPLSAENTSRYLEAIESLFWPLVRQYQKTDGIGDLHSLEEASTALLDMVLFGVLREK